MGAWLAGALWLAVGKGRMCVDRGRLQRRTGSRGVSCDDHLIPFERTSGLLPEELVPKAIRIKG